MSNFDDFDNDQISWKLAQRQPFVFAFSSKFFSSLETKEILKMPKKSPDIFQIPAKSKERGYKRIWYHDEGSKDYLRFKFHRMNALEREILLKLSLLKAVLTETPELLLQLTNCAQYTMQNN